MYTFLMPASRLITRTVRLYYVTRVLETAHFTLGVYLIYLTQYVGLSFTQALALYVVMVASSTFFDLYGGGLADARGRKRSYVFGIAISLAAFYLPVLFIENFYILLSLAAVAGLGSALSSNTITSIIADLLQHDQHRYRQVNAHSQVALFVSRATAAVLGGLLFELASPLPFIAEAVALAAAALVAMAMHDPRGDLPPEPSTVRRLVLDALLHIRKAAPLILRSSLALGFSALLAGDLLFTYLQPFFSSHGFSPTQLGILFACISLLSALGSWCVQYLHHRGWRLGVIILAAAIIAVNGLGIASNVATIALATIALQAIVNGMTIPTQRLIANESVPSRIRTTVLSASTTVTSAFMLAGFMISGLLADSGTPRIAGLSAALLALIGLAIAVYALRLQRRTKHTRR